MTINPDTTLQSLTVDQLVVSARQGDRSAFGVLVQRHAAMVTGVAYSIVGDFAHSEDVGQEVFLEAWQKLSELSDASRFAAWVCSIARHRAVDAVRRRRRATDVHAAERMPPEIADGGEKHDPVSDDERQAVVWASLDALPSKYRETLVLYYRGGKSVSEVAAALDLSQAAVRQRLARGRKMLRHEVESVIDRTLRGTTPGVVFLAAVLGSLHGNVAAGVAGIAAGKSSAVGVAATSAKVLGTGTTISGAIFGLFGGLAGGAFGAWVSYRNAPYTTQKLLIVRFLLLSVFALVVCAAMLMWLVGQRSGPVPMDDGRYAIALLGLILTMQLLFFAASWWGARRFRQLGDIARSEGRAMDPVASRRLAGIRRAEFHWSTRNRFAGRPWVDVRFGPVSHDGRVAPTDVAKGWIAVGDRADGWLIAIGNRARGLIACGGWCFGGLTIGGFGIGVIHLGGLGVAILSIAGLAFGGIAIGGIAVGWYSLGGLAIGKAALGGAAFASHAAIGGVAWSAGQAKARLDESTEAGGADLERLEMWRRWTENGLPTPWADVLLLTGGGILFALVLLKVIAWRLAMRQAVLTGRIDSKHPAVASTINDALAFYGSLIGCSVWVVGIGFDVASIATATAGLILYLAAAAVSFWTARYDWSTQRLGRAFAVSILAADLATTTAIVMSHWIDGWERSGGFSWWAYLGLSQIGYVALAILALVLTQTSVTRSIAPESRCG
ncbi:RNA polymerase sigma factor [Crateriforma conspicua]|uniref:ECF RNA polymerase sigma factor SigW n=1 Tax=Crateriforma conspicua TaxID=2527996 RepID=A0A5C5Y6W7_9PLAN|nr:sigma-70 family RNA polymerase sigma factor [Crateriforma conspicua]TWT70914.1 ECF RNA polymerase sigma factor SigW [Crateriforma conspicua]